LIVSANDADGRSFSTVAAGRDWEFLVVHDLGEPIFATPTPDDGRLYVRTRSTLYCFAASR